MIIVSPLHVVPELVETHSVGRVLGLLAGADEHPDLPELAASGNHLKLVMNDIAFSVDGMTLPGANHVTQLIEFIGEWDQNTPLLIHCWAGISRSTASAYIAQCLLNPDRDEAELAQELRRLSPPATPNPLLVAHADDILGRGGRMQAAIEEIGRGENAYEGNVFKWAV